jgi:flagellar biosynthetic protein FliQ
MKMGVSRLTSNFIISLSLFSFSFLLPLLAVGVLGGVFQAATQIREASLVVVGKLGVIFFIVILAGAKIFELLTVYAKDTYRLIPAIIHP